LKITPGHDPNDYAIGKKLGLPFINIFNKDATLNENAGDYWYISIPCNHRRCFNERIVGKLLSDGFFFCHHFMLI